MTQTLSEGTVARGSQVHKSAMLLLLIVD